MSFTPSTVTGDAIRQMAGAFHAILDKAEAHSKATGVPESVYLNWRLSPDMFPMARQIQIACDIAARGSARLAGADMPVFEDNETTFAAFRARVDKVVGFIATLDTAAIDRDPDGTVTFPVGDQQKTMVRGAYVTRFILSNVYFHVTAAYANLRACGVPVGKGDYLVWG